ncbi:far upstream element-binding protein 2-like, partial [Onychostruthus taczanowskii]|uniref:far upstream element-binding protein 2-like n=1 Tax=Onychostruthus taczanowskii TaxID=356909 RepID=UPI001B80D03B
ERAGVKMILIQDGSQNTNVDKPLRIIGEPYKVQQACEMVLDILRERDQGGFGDRSDYGARLGGGIDVSGSPESPRNYPGVPPKLPWSPPETTLESPRNYPGVPPKLPWSPPETTLESPRNYPGVPPKLPWSPPETTLESPRNYPGVPPKLPWSPPETTLESPRNYPGVTPGIAPKLP